MKNWKYYNTIWVMLFLGWFIAYVDRNLMSPIVTYIPAFASLE